MEKIKGLIVIAMIVITIAIIVFIFKRKIKDIKHEKKVPLILKGSLNSALSDVMMRISNDVQIFDELKSHAKSLDELARDSQLPLLVVVMGEFKTGKSTFINTLLGEDCLKSDVTPATAVVTMLKYDENKSLIAHFKDGSFKEYPSEKLDVLSAEGNPEGEELRSKISYLEMSIPNPILKDITIVDTPGLNSDKYLHTIATKEFINRADLVLWIFSYAKAGSKTEMAEIKSLGANLRPISIVNRIDEIDPEEDDIDEILDDLRKRMGNAVSHLVGISAFEAREAQKSNDADRLKESRWGDFQKVFNDELLGKCEYKKSKSILVRLRDCIRKLNITFLSKEEEYKEAFNMVNNTTATTQKIKERMAYFRKLVIDWTPRQDKKCLDITGTLSELASDIENFERLNLNKNKIEGVYDALTEEAKTIATDRSQLDREIDNHNKEVGRHNIELNKFNKSGLFGGRPLLDFNGNGDRLDNHTDNLNSKTQILNSQSEAIKSRRSALISRFDRNEQETKDFWTNVRNNINNSIKALENKLSNIEEERRLSKIKIERLEWVVDARNKMDNSIAIDLNSGLKYVEEKLGLDQTQISIGINEAINKIDEIVEKISSKINENISSDNETDGTTESNITKKIEEAEQGDGFAQYNLGVCYFNGQDVVQDYKQAVYWYKKAADQEDASAQASLGYCYKYGIGVEKDENQAVSWYKKAAYQGNASAQDRLGDCYRYGTGIAKDENQAVYWYKKAADQGNASAQASLGNCYYMGTGITKDENQAVYWYKKAAYQGNAWAQDSLGDCYKYGTGIAKDENQAVSWYKKAADQGNAWAQYSLGSCYEYSIGIAKDENQAISWYKKAADQGNASAQDSLGDCYKYGTGIAKDENQAVYWYKKAADQGNESSQYSLGYCYEYGTGIAKDENQAVYWYKKAADQGNAWAQDSLGCCYYEGTGIAKDENQAVYWYKKAADQGNASAQANLGFCYYEGTGIAKNENQAVYWYKKAADQGNVRAQCGLGCFYECGVGIAKNENQAVYWYKKAADQGNAWAQYSLGNYYYDGNVVKKDYNQAGILWEKSAKQGLDDAVENLKLLKKDYNDKYIKR